ncbi:hypothetical protein [Leucobacter chromiireducens]|uniref:Uncharacterized protein n=1 Tax=Leucobacter chromiireducens subsp. solipictus TaxID=398235 RepID=A0ABS1SEI9_9MICO|nr:hypothetical protein [Leucobacter chromiireducens]MBL3678786.1 hypothetical protein [Leucobacter chromiireducens subsp. solipictus]
MTRTARRPLRIVLFVLLGIAVLVLAGVLVVLLPILTHQSAGGSGQEIPTGYVAAVSATGEDGRTRTLSVETPDGKPAELDSLRPGDTLVVTGDGFDAGIGIYLAICGIPASADEKPGPCLGGVPEGAEAGDAGAQAGLSSAWITDAWAWRAFATQGYADADRGTFTATLTVPDPVVDGFDCRDQRCAIATRADHTAAKDRVQDMLLPVAFGD